MRRCSSRWRRPPRLPPPTIDRPCRRLGLSLFHRGIEASQSIWAMVSVSRFGVQMRAASRNCGQRSGVRAGRARSGNHGRRRGAQQGAVRRAQRQCPLNGGAASAYAPRDRLRARPASWRQRQDGRSSSSPRKSRYRPREP